MGRNEITVGNRGYKINVDSVSGQLGLEPFLNFNFIITTKNPMQADLKMSVQVYIETDHGTLINAGPLFFEDEWDSEGDTNYFNGQLFLDYYKLSRIEEIRSNNDLKLFLRGYLIQLENQRCNSGQFEIDYKIAQSDWIKHFLTPFNCKHIQLVEIPSIIGFDNIMKHLDSAWVSKSRGEYDGVLTNCRKVIEEIGQYVKEQGFEKESLDEKGKKVPDWDKYFNSETIGDVFGNINKKISGFMALGAHTGKTISLAEADYALLITHAIANYAIKRRPGKTV